ncbi:MAG: hypothetical protein ACK4S2_04755 [Gemmobacter sp.]|uniref:hypothetical protein n=1 Tax=Gemmobacter sp. TaxID=1898957 RepID=UPI00391E00AB
MPLAVVFGEKPEWRRSLTTELSGPVWRCGMAPFRPEAGPPAADLLVPLSLEDQYAVECWRDRGAAVPALICPAAVRDLCHDKLAFARRLAAAGLGHLCPPILDRLPQGAAGWPVVLKLRQDAWGANTHILHDPSEAAPHAAALDDPAWFLQAHVAGNLEWTTHVLMCAGRPAWMRSVCYDMGAEDAVKGKAPGARILRWTEGAPCPDDCLRVLDAVDLRDGLSRLNYKITADGNPLFFEVNPRFGGSLVPEAAGLLPAYAACLGLRPPARNRLRQLGARVTAAAVAAMRPAAPKR